MTSAQQPPGPPLPRWLQTLGFRFMPLRFIDVCRRRYGDVVTFGTLKRPRFVMVFDSELLRQVVQATSEQLAVASDRARNRLVGEQSVVVLNGLEHVGRRRHLSPRLHGGRLRGYTELIRDATDRAIDSWPTGQPFELLSSVHALAFDVIARVVLGLGPGPRQDELLRRLRRATGSSARRRLMIGPSAPIDDRLPVDELIYEEIERRRMAPDREEHDDMLSMLLRVRDEDGQARDQELCDDLVSLLAGGYETVASALAWTFELLLRHPAALKHLEAALAKGDQDYLQAVMRESLRLRPPVVLVRRVVRDEPYELGGYLILPGTEIRLPVRYIHGLADHYPEPRAFRPERFLDSDRPDGYAWLPFGGGVHRCLGASFALFEIAIVIPRVLERAHLELVGRRSEKAIPEGFTQVPARGVRISQRPRERQSETAAREPSAAARRELAAP
jgi:cytochrome P450